MKRNISILVVDDEPMMRTLVEKILSRQGFVIHSAENGQHALEILDQVQPDIIISDVKMPKVDGFGLLKAVKEVLPNVGVIMMTAYGDTYTVKDALLLGADEYITKPFKSHEISLVVERVYWRILSASNGEQEPAVGK